MGSYKEPTRVRNKTKHGNSESRVVPTPKQSQLLVHASSPSSKALSKFEGSELQERSKAIAQQLMTPRSRISVNSANTERELKSQRQNDNSIHIEDDTMDLGWNFVDEEEEQRKIEKNVLARREFTKPRDTVINSAQSICTVINEKKEQRTLSYCDLFLIECNRA